MLVATLRGAVSPRLFILYGGLWSSLLLAVPSRAAQPASSWQARWDRAVEAAKKEGQVVLYVFGGQSSLPIEAGVFQKRFPGIKVVSVSGDPVTRILTERRAGKYLADVAIGGATTPYELYRANALDSIRDAMILPEVRDESKWWGGQRVAKGSGPPSAISEGSPISREGL
jgi:hypothetical protein